MGQESLSASAARPERSLGHGGGRDGGGDEQKRRGSDKQSQYDPNSAFQVIGDGQLTAEQMKKLTPDERRQVVN
ncbi:hypothetical protein CK489_23305 [Bradyrhizobium sp. UFLA03-84]|uniref:hypothetical protein n=1 Tax=Bradyrhizobium sp. UFLA03-84 TaxID=418599 RepID=UPI000BAE302B|nr:hypothetical protein [Bradyrhizobium sp. UFLA03-84]PAY05877.1 hypothetical protein CK489_23305 [Bradyrhizobium sp. UFLA03-84]